MKRTVRDNNVRQYKINNPYQQRTTQSQSPPQKRLLTKINSTSTKRHEFSMQNIELPPEKPAEKAPDFRLEIERRFQDSSSNQNYVFPRKEQNNTESERENSLESLRYITTYDLTTQNFRNTDLVGALLKSHVLEKGFETEPPRLFSEPPDNISELYAIYDSDSEEPIEVRIRDKYGATYRKLMRLLELQPMLSHNSTNANSKKDKELPGLCEPDIAREEGILNFKTADSAQNLKKTSYVPHKKDILSNFTTEASTSNAEIGFRSGYFVHEKTRNAKSSDRLSQRVETSDGFTDNHGSKSILVDTGRKVNPGLKQFFPQYAGTSKAKPRQYAIGSSNINDIFSREGMVKSYNNESMRIMHTSTGRVPDNQAKGSNPLENLYRKAQKGIIQNKLRVGNGFAGVIKPIVVAHTTKNSQDANSMLNASNVFFKRSETPNSAAKRIDFANFQISKPMPLERLVTVNTPGGDAKISKPGSVRALHVFSPLKISEDMQFSKSSNTTQPKFFKKTFLKIEVGKRSQGSNSRQVRTHISNRNITPERPTNDSAQNAILRTSYDANNNTNNGSLLGVSVPKGITKTSSTFLQKSSYKKSDSMI